MSGNVIYLKNKLTYSSTRVIISILPINLNKE